MLVGESVAQDSSLVAVAAERRVKFQVDLWLLLCYLNAQSGSSNARQQQAAFFDAEGRVVHIPELNIQLNGDESTGIQNKRGQQLSFADLLLLIITQRHDYTIPNLDALRCKYINIVERLAVIDKFTTTESGAVPWCGGGYTQGSRHLATGEVRDASLGLVWIPDSKNVSKLRAVNIHSLHNQVHTATASNLHSSTTGTAPYEYDAVLPRGPTLDGGYSGSPSVDCDVDMRSTTGTDIYYNAGRNEAGVGSASVLQSGSVQSEVNGGAGVGVGGRFDILGVDGSMDVCTGGSAESKTHLISDGRGVTSSMGGAVVRQQVLSPGMTYGYSYCGDTAAVNSNVLIGGATTSTLRGRETGSDVLLKMIDNRKTLTGLIQVQREEEGFRHPVHTASPWTNNFRKRADYFTHTGGLQSWVVHALSSAPDVDPTVLSTASTGGSGSFTGTTCTAVRTVSFARASTVADNNLNATASSRSSGGAGSSGARSGWQAGAAGRISGVQQRRMGIHPSSMGPSSSANDMIASSTAAALYNAGGGTRLPTVIDEIVGKYRLRPIIIVPTEPSVSIVNIHNAVDFFNKGHFVDMSTAPPVSNRQGDYLEVARVIRGKTLKFRLLPSSELYKLSGDRWRAVVAVVASGADWQFKGWPFKTFYDVFRTLRGFHFAYENTEIAKNVLKWNCQVFRLHRDRQHTHVSAQNEFWKSLEAFLQTRRLSAIAVDHKLQV
eukprot:Lankesteria_metandrocarpae@DN4298_c0_g1_i1.p1